MITLGSLTRTAKAYALDTSVSDEAFLNAMLEPLVIAGRVRARGGKPFELDKSRTSRIMNGRCDVPIALRKALPRYGIEKSTAEGFGPFLEEHMDMNFFEPFARDVLSLSSVSEESRKRMGAKIDEPEQFMALALLESIKNDNRDSRERSVWNNGTGSLHIEVGDIFAHGFGKPLRTKRIVVIPVDTSFETRVTHGYEDTASPLISPRTLHGKWLMRMDAAGTSPEELDDRIESSLRRRSISPLKNANNERSRPEYPIGTVAVIESARSVFFLLAIARLDENNNASATRDEIEKAVELLLAAYDRYGQGLDLYIPLIGTGESRANLTHQESFDLVTGIVTKHKSKVHGRITVVVFRDDSNKLDTTYGGLA